MKYLNAFEDRERGLLVFLFRDNNGTLKKREIEASYSAFIDKSKCDSDLMNALFRATGKNLPIRKITESKNYYRIDWHSWFDRKEAVGPGGGFIRRGVQTFEGDVHPLRRFMSDNDIEIATPHRGYLDIETDSRVPFDRKGEARILSWCLCDENETVIDSMVLDADTDEAEKKLVAKFWQCAEKYDQLIAWNGDFFDFIVLQARAQYLNIPVKFKRWLYLDHLVLFRRLNTASESGEEKQSYKLGDIASAVLGETKDDFNSRHTWQAWVAGGESRERLLKYNIKDVLLLCRLERKTGYIKLFQTLCEVSHGFCETLFLNPSRQLDGYMLKLGSQRDLHFPTRVFDDENEDDDNDPYAGAYVIHPEENAGILKGVHVCDFASLYPSIMLTWNMSPETKEITTGSYCKSPSTGVRFSNIEGAILPTALRELIRLRKEWNDKKANAAPGTQDWYDADRRSTAYKVAANSFYGVVGSTYSRYYDRQIAESVTQNGQWLIKKTIEQTQRRGWKAVYGDTDSVFITGCTKGEFSDFVDWCNSTYYPEILKQCGCVYNNIKLAYEKQFDWLVFTAAKRYVGIYLHYKGKEATINSKPEVKGLEFKRGDTLQLARRFQEDIIKLFCGKVDDPAIYTQVVERCMYRILNEPLNREDVQMSKGISKPLDQYASQSLPQVRIAKILLERGEQISTGTKVQYIVTDSTVTPQQIIPAEDWTGECDRYYLWESLVYPPSLRLLAAIFPNKKDVFEKYERARPKKTRGERIPEKNERNGQVSMFPDITASKLPPTVDLSGVVTVAPKQTRGGPFVIEIDESKTRIMGQLKELFLKYPGNRKVVIECKLKSSVVILDVPITISVSPEFKHQLEQLLN